MHFTAKYRSPAGELLLSADEIGLTGVWLENDKYFATNLSSERVEKEIPVLTETKRWLDIYFTGTEPDFTPRLHMLGTEFQIEVWKILRKIPYGKTVTYGDIAAEIARKRGIARMSAQAVGGAVGRNKFSIIVPCHRVVGTNGDLTGYAGGIDKKIQLLKLEGAFRDEFFVPKHSTAP